MKTEAIIGGILLAGGIGFTGFVLYKIMSAAPHPLGGEFDVFTGFKVSDTEAYHNTMPTSCKNKCLADPECTAASFQIGEENICILTKKDPYSSYEETDPGAWQLFIRRQEGVPESKWGSWDPDQCPPCGEKTDLVMRRKCLGPKCLGKSERQCDVGGCFDRFQGMIVR